jgi:hypothetical protein
MQQTNYYRYKTKHLEEVLLLLKVGKIACPDPEITAEKIASVLHDRSTSGMKMCEAMHMFLLVKDMANTESVKLREHTKAYFDWTDEEYEQNRKLMQWWIGMVDTSELDPEYDELGENDNPLLTNHFTKIV